MKILKAAAIFFASPCILLFVNSLCYQLSTSHSKITLRYKSHFPLWPSPLLPFPPSPSSGPTITETKWISCWHAFCNKLLQQDYEFCFSIWWCCEGVSNIQLNEVSFWQLDLWQLNTTHLTEGVACRKYTMIDSPTRICPESKTPILLARARVCFMHKPRADGGTPADDMIYTIHILCCTFLTASHPSQSLLRLTHVS
jgi:hypothetical protein